MQEEYLGDVQIYCTLYFSNDSFIRMRSILLRKNRNVLQDNEWSGRDRYWHILPFYLGVSDRDSKMQEQIEGIEKHSPRRRREKRKQEA